MVPLAAQLDRDVATAVQESPPIETMVATLDEQSDWARGTTTSLLSAPPPPLPSPSIDEVIRAVERIPEEQRGGRSETGAKPTA